MTLGVKFAIGALAAALVLMTSGCVGGDEGPFISAGANHSCGVQHDGRLACWGSDGDGEVSGPNGSTDIFAQVAAGDSLTCALNVVGNIECWGYDNSGQVSGPNSSTAKFRQIAIGESHTCGLTTGKRFTCWGATAQDGSQARTPAATSSTRSAWMSRLRAG